MWLVDARPRGRSRRRYGAVLACCGALSLTACAPNSPQALAPSTASTSSPAGPVPTVAPTTQVASSARQLPVPVSGTIESQPLRVGFYGDSLAWEAEPAFVAEAQRRGWTVTPGTFGGTAPCDWAAAVDPSLDVVALVFSGNNLTPCAEGVGGGDLAADYAASYTAIRDALPADTLLVLVGTPPVRAESTDVAVAGTRVSLMRTIVGLADVLVNTSYVDAGARVADTQRRFAERLACEEGEACGPDGTVPVRSPDGVHFCPAGEPAVDGITGRCDVASPGAQRFAGAIADGIAAEVNRSA
jgi:hypothetical protein